MSEIIVERGDPRHPEAEALLVASQALMRALYPPEDNFYLGTEALAAPGILFFVARQEGRTVGTGALALREDYGEVKAMFTHVEARGMGVAARVLAAIEEAARAEGLPLLRLETGNTLYAAHRLYEAAGFSRRGPFGEYPEAASSLFMEKRLGD